MCSASSHPPTAARIRTTTPGRILRDHEDGLTSRTPRYTVGEAVTHWLDYALSGRSPGTVAKYRTISDHHIIPPLGRRRLADLSAEDVDRWLRAESSQVSTRTLRLMHSILNRAVNCAMARDKVRRNVVGLCEIPTGKVGRSSKSLTFAQAEKLLTAAEGSPLRAYIVLSLLVGARTEELRALCWGRCRPRRQAGRCSAGPALDLRSPLGAARRRHQDSQVEAADRHAAPLRRRAPAAQGWPRRRP